MMQGLTRPPVHYEQTVRGCCRALPAHQYTMSKQVAEE
jgi:hypothetical protein